MSHVTCQGWACTPQHHWQAGFSTRSFRATSSGFASKTTMKPKSSPFGAALPHTAVHSLGPQASGGPTLLLAGCSQTALGTVLPAEPPAPLSLHPLAASEAQAAPGDGRAPKTQTAFPQTAQNACSHPQMNFDELAMWKHLREPGWVSRSWVQGARHRGWVQRLGAGVQVQRLGAGCSWDSRLRSSHR